jgi:hypothetical protein
MNRRQLALVIILNALISLTIAVTVVWVVEQRRPDPETLAALATPITAPVVAPTFTPTPARMLRRHPCRSRLRLSPRRAGRRRNLRCPGGRQLAGDCRTLWHQHSRRSWTPTTSPTRISSFPASGW